MKENCKNCKHLIRQGIEYTSPGGGVTIQDFKCNNIGSLEYGQTMNAIIFDGQTIDSSERNTCLKWESKF
jgi:hypothetical protein